MSGRATSAPEPDGSGTPDPSPTVARGHRRVLRAGRSPAVSPGLSGR